MKKIVVINGSPRKKGNSFAMSQAFIEKAESLGHTVTRFDAAFLNVGSCQGCETCYKTGKACSFDDDFNTIAKAIEEADGIVLSMPVYWYTMPAKIKSVIDKFFAFYVTGKNQNKKCALLSCCEDEDPTVLDGVQMPYEKSIALLKWTSVGEVLVPNVYRIGDIEKTDGCQQAAKLAELF